MDLVFPHTFVPWFRSVAPHIHAHRGKTFVVGLSGELIAAGNPAGGVHDDVLAHLGAFGVQVLLYAQRPEMTAQGRARAVAKTPITQLQLGLPARGEQGGIGR